MDGFITENFKKSEFTCKCGCGKNNIDANLVNRLQVIRDMLGVRIIILSGSRCENHNSFIHGSMESFHLSGEAADITLMVSAETLREIWLEYLGNWSGGAHYYPEGHFIHLDIGPRRRW